MPSLRPSSVSGAGPSHWLERWIGFVQANARRVLVVAATLALVSLGYAAARLGFKTDRLDLVSSRAPFKRDLEACEWEFRGDADIIFLVEGTDRSQVIAAIETLARDLAACPTHFEKVCHRLVLDKLLAKGLYQLPLEDLRKIHSGVQSMGPLLVGTWQWLSVENVLVATRLAVNNVAPSQALDPKSRDLLASTTRLIESLATYLRDESVYRSPWKDLFQETGKGAFAEAPEYFFGADGRMAFLRAQPVACPGRAPGSAEPVRVARAIVERVQRAFPRLKLGMTGLPVLEHDEMLAANQDSARACGLSLIAVTLIFVVGFRSLRRPLYAIVALVLSGCWTMGWITLTVGHLNLLSVSFLVTLIGLGIDYSIVWLSRHEIELGAGRTPAEAGLATARGVGPGIVTGCLTTALAFYATLVTDFLGLKELGWIAGGGILFCLLGALTVLPALLVVMERGHSSKFVRLPVALPAFPWLDPHPAWVLGVASVGIALAVGALRHVSFDYNLLNLQSHGLAAVEWEKRLIQDTGTSAWYALSVADTPEEARGRKERFQELPTVGRVVEIASMIPAGQAEKEPVVRQIGNLLTKLPKAAELPDPLPPNPDGVRDLLLGMAHGTRGCHPDDRILVGHVGDACQRLVRAFERFAPRERARLLGQFERAWICDLLDRLWSLRSVANPEPVTIADLPSVLVERYHGRTGKWLVQVFAKQSVWDYGPMVQFREEVTSVDPRATGKPISTLHSLEQMTDGYRRGALVAVLVIFVAVYWDLRRLSDTLLAAVPLSLGSVVTLGAMGWLGIPLNPANLIAFPLILGIGIDGGVHVMHEYRARVGRYFVSRDLFRALSLCGLTSIAGFASLILAQHRGMASIGQVLSLGIAACSASALVVLPAILRLLPEKESAALADTPTMLLELPSTALFKRSA